MKLKTIGITIGNYYYFMKGMLYPSRITSGKDIPIIINNFNRLTTLRQLIESLVERGYDNIHIIDNASTYPPLLEYYKTCPYKVYMLKENLGFKALWKSGLYKKLCKDYYVYTDSDVVPIKECPSDFIDHFLSHLKKYPFARKVGFSLMIDDLPEHYELKDKVIDWEKNFYVHPINDELFRAPIDTTFALYRPFVGLSRSRQVEAYRTAHPYQAHHLPWYNDSQHLSDEEQYYINNSKGQTAWTSKSK